VRAELWGLIAALAVVTMILRGAGPALLGGRDLPAWTVGVIELTAPALLAALVVTQALADGGRIAVGAHTAGVAAAAVVLVRGGSVVLGVGVAAVVTAALRAVT
jgi:branched-subunit amino acid transport protein